MKRRLMIARALVHEPKLLILDEPTAGVDIEIRRSMWQFLRDINAAGVTIILTTHYLEEAESLCRHVAIIDAGSIIKNDRMENVVRELQTEVFVLSLRDALGAVPEIPGYGLTQRGDRELEAEVANGKGLNALFEALSRASIEVVSMRTRSNRLEELFVRLVRDRRQGNGHQGNGQ
jgi:ABC-2 type transport system ATP-binding protein